MGAREAYPGLKERMGCVPAGSGFDTPTFIRNTAGEGRKSTPNSREERNMQKTMKNPGMATLTAALLAGTCLFSAPAKADVAAGEALYKAKCGMCHGEGGKGKEAMKTKDQSSADVQKMSDTDLSAAITGGKGKMPAFKTLTPDQVKDLVAYIRSLKK
jgi:mono/diheme cytochrome c family protein